MSSANCAHATRSRSHRGAVSDGAAIISHSSARQPARLGGVSNSPSSSVWRKRASDVFPIPGAKRSKIGQASDKATGMAGQFQKAFNDLLKHIEAWKEEEDHHHDAIEMDEVVTCWKTAVDTVLMPAKLPPEQLILLDLHLPLPVWLSPIHRGLLEAANGICMEFATSVKHAQSTLLSPFDFGKPSGWGKGQDDVTHIMCLRPTLKNSVPVCALHDVFRQFIIDATGSLPEDCSTTVDAVKSAQMLCSMMGEHFKDEAARTNQFDTGVESLFERQRWSHKYQFNASSDLRYGEVDCVFLADGSILIILCEDKWEPRQGVSDVYMQLACDYDLAVKVLEQNERHDPRWTSFLAQGSPMFLISVLGAQLSVLGGFYDGKHVIMEPLQDTYYMLHDSRGIRQDRLAKVLYALAKGQSTLERLNLNEMPPTFPSSTPRIYESVTLYAKSGASAPGKLAFEDRLLTSSQRWLFHATLLTPSRLRSPTPVVVKLIDRLYGEHVHQLLA
ncbi:uncharacterized protein LAESUDRAFT_764590 [Laetiporus sulphureus 93-53]|uniref:Uncharacterized protein n=1 Tax=Laetiporus sulphureus 93-53 TaxID=1314785 RepID=A0A165B7Z2_9APHY|nr:uncharacterized protein LAESUDRAFT_764590 [Laetiporus sulphureus 93-53]KZT00452.1 hypothetical protein LAESUDRAFT_764590 [Laetiporus sulphureus 93-53]